MQQKFFIESSLPSRPFFLKFIFELRLKMKVKNDHRSKFSNFIFNRRKWIISYTSHHFTPHGTLCMWYLTNSMIQLKNTMCDIQSHEFSITELCNLLIKFIIESLTVVTQNNTNSVFDSGWTILSNAWVGEDLRMNPSWLYSTVKCDVIKNLVKTPGPLRSTKNFRPGRG